MCAGYHDLSLLSLNRKFCPNSRNPREHQNRPSGKHRHSRKYNSISIPPIIMRYQRPCNRRTRQHRKTHHTTVNTALTAKRGYVKTIPMRTPILLISWISVRAAMPAGGKLTNVPEKNPYSKAKTTKPRHEEIPSQPNKRIPEVMTVGMITLIGPAQSAMKFGMIRPNIEAA